jgi:hypothetical protein
MKHPASRGEEEEAVICNRFKGTRCHPLQGHMTGMTVRIRLAAQVIDFVLRLVRRMSGKYLMNRTITSNPRGT